MHAIEIGKLSFSDGNMVVAIGGDNRVAIAWKETNHNLNQLTQLEPSDAIAVMTLLGCALGFDVRKRDNEAIFRPEFEVLENQESVR